MTTRPQTEQTPQTSKEVIAANVTLLIQQLEAGHSESLAAYLTAMSRFHKYSFGNILEIARQKPEATRVAGFHAWKQLGRSVTKSQKGIRILAPMIGNKRRKDKEATKETNTAAHPFLVGFRAVYVFDVSQTEGAELPDLKERVKGDVGEYRDRLIAFLIAQGIELEFNESIAPALSAIEPPTAADEETASAAELTPTPRDQSRPEPRLSVYSLDRPLFAKSLIAQVLIQLAPEKLADPHAEPHATEACDNQKDNAMGWHGFQDIYGRFVSAPDAKNPL